MSTASCERFPVIFSILIEGPGWNNSEFYGKWLLAAAYAQRLWTEAIEFGIGNLGRKSND